MNLNQLPFFTCMIALFTASLAQATEEVVYGVELTHNSLQFQVASGGCTQKEDFELEVVQGSTELPTYVVTLNRVNPDYCRALVPDGVQIKYARKDVGLEDKVAFTLTNKIGNRPQYSRLQLSPSKQQTGKNTPISALLNRPVRVYTTGEALTREYIADRVNIELDKAGNIVKIWFG